MSFILVIPTYDAEITEVVNDFLDIKVTRTVSWCSWWGNRNFAELFVYTAKDIAAITTFRFYTPLSLAEQTKTWRPLRK